MKTTNEPATGVPSRHWMDAYGIKFEERLTVTKAQLELKMRPCFPLKTRIWAYLILHTAGYQGEHAQTMEKGQKRAVEPPDIANELQRAAGKYYRDAAILFDKAAYQALRPNKDDMRRALAAMEEDGICERRYKGTPLRSMPLKDRQARLNGKIDLYVWLRPKKASAETIKQEWEQEQVKEVSPPEFKMEHILKHLKIETAKLSLFIRHLEPTKQQAVSEAWEQFVQVVNNCIPEVVNIAPPEVAAQCPPFFEEVVEEIKDPVQPHHPPEVEAKPETGMRMRQDYPLTLQTLREKDPAVKEAFVRRLVSDTLAYCGKHPQFPAENLPLITDRAIAAMCKESFRTGPKNHGIGLLLSRVPPIAVTWSIDDEETSASQQRTA